MNTNVRVKRLLNLVMAGVLCVTLVGTGTPVRSYSVYAASEEDLLTEDQNNDSSSNADSNDEDGENDDSSEANSGATNPENGSDETDKNSNSSNSSDAVTSEKESDNADSADKANSENGADAEDSADIAASENSADNKDGSNEGDSESSSDDADGSNEGGSENSTDDADGSNEGGSENSSDDVDSSDKASSENNSDSDNSSDATSSDSANESDSSNASNNSNSGSGADGVSDRSSNSRIIAPVDDEVENNSDNGDTDIIVDDDQFITSEGDIIKDIALTVTTKDGETKDVVADENGYANTEISFSDKLTFTFTLQPKIAVDFTEEMAAEIENTFFVKNGQEFYVDIDTTLFNDASSLISELTYTDKESGREYVFAKVSKNEPDNNLKLEIADNNSNAHSVEDVRFGYEVSLCATDSRTEDEEDFEFSVGDVTYKVHLKDNEKNPPKMEAKGEYIAADDVIEWTVEIKNDAEHQKFYENGYAFSTELLDGQNYVPDSMKLNGGSVAPGRDGNVLSCELSDNDTQSDNTITFRTTVPKEDFVKKSIQNFNEGKTSLDFGITANAKDGNELVCEAQATAPATKNFEKTWVSKESVGIDEDGKASWKIEINTNGYTFDELTLYDKFNTDGSTVMKRVGDVTITGATGTVTDGTSADDYDFKVDFGTVVGLDVPTITVEYTTQIEDFEKFQTENHTIPGNKAWVSYKDSEGIVPGEKTIDVKIKGDSVQEKAGISKTFVKYDSVTHEITWHVVANKNKRSLRNISIKDQTGIEGDDHELVAIKNFQFSNTETTKENITVPSGSKEYTIPFGDMLDGSSVSFDVITVVKDEKFWSDNAARTFRNDVWLNRTVEVPVDEEHPDGTELKEIAQDSDTHNIGFTFVTMKSLGYDHNTHCIDYEIALKSGNIAVSDVIVTDTIDSGVEYITDSLKVNDVQYTDFEVTEDGKLVIRGLDFSDTDVDRKIKFTGKVTDEFISSIENGKRKPVRNSVIVTTAANPGGQPVEPCEDTVTNKLLLKEGKKVDGLAKFTVSVNGGKLSIAQGTAIKDVMGKSFELNLESVKLYTAVVDKAGNLSKGDEYKDVTVLAEKLDGKTVLSVKFNSDTSDAYILEYDAFPSYPEYKDYVNKVSLISSNGDEKQNVNYDKLVSAFSSGSSSSYTMFKLTVSDAESNEKLPDVTYDVYEEGVEEPLYKIKTSGNTLDYGTRSLFNKLNKTKTYYLRQVDAPEGYKLDTEKKHYVEKVNNTTFKLDLTLEKDVPEVPDTPNNDPTDPDTPGDEPVVPDTPGDEPTNPDTLSEDPKNSDVPTNPSKDDETKDPANTETPGEKTGDEKAEEPSKEETHVDPAENVKPEEPAKSDSEKADSKNDDANKADSNKDDANKAEGDSKKTRDEEKSQNSDSGNSSSDDEEGSEQIDKKNTKDKKISESKDSKSDDKSDKKKSSDGSKKKDKTSDDADQNDESGDSSDNGSSTDGSAGDGTAVNVSSNNGGSGNASGNTADNATEPDGDGNTAGKTLAKTGGFFGTFYGYLAGLMLIIGGAIITFKKRKKN